MSTENPLSLSASSSLRALVQQFVDEHKAMAHAALTEGPIPGDEQAHAGRWTMAELMAEELERILSAALDASPEPFGWCSKHTFGSNVDPCPGCVKEDASLREGSPVPVREPEATPIHTGPICGPECQC
jgi:hypothetical protein